MPNKIINSGEIIILIQLFYTFKFIHYITYQVTAYGSISNNVVYYIEYCNVQDVLSIIHQKYYIEDIAKYEFIYI